MKIKKTVETIKITDGMLSNLKGYGGCLPEKVILSNSINLYFYDKKYKVTDNILRFPLYTAHFWTQGVGMGESYGYNFNRSNIYFYIDKESADTALKRLINDEHKASEIKKIVTEAKAEAEAEAKIAYNEVYYKAIERLGKERNISIVDIHKHNV